MIGAVRRASGGGDTVTSILIEQILILMRRKSESCSGPAHAPALRDRTSQSLLEWASMVVGEWGQVPAAHHRLLMWELAAISRGSIDRLMVLMPPGSAKSTYASVLFPAWWFRQHPSSSVIATCHTASLATHIARQIRQVIHHWSSQLGYGLEAKTRAAAEWRISTGGEYFSSGTRGPIMGRRADLAIIDDPIKSLAEADSLRSREHLWNWYRYDLTTRLKPNARVILIMTRWHEDDLAGRLLAQNANEWRCLSLPALAAPSDPLGRVPEAPLWPTWESEQALLRKRSSLGERAWSAMFQQAPSRGTGSLFRVTRIEFRDELPNDGNPAVRAWDLAATSEAESGAADWTVGVKLMRDASGAFVVADVVRVRVGSSEVETLLVATARRDGPSVIIGLPQDPGQAGKSQITYLTRMMAGYVVTSSKETGAKETRAAAVASQIHVGNLSLLRASWNHAFIEELREFPFGRNDDQVDALSRAFHTLIEAPATARRLTVSLLAR